MVLEVRITPVLALAVLVWVRCCDFPRDSNCAIDNHIFLLDLRPLHLQTHIASLVEIPRTKIGRNHIMVPDVLCR
jgi:hypothetical protein